jgi:pimeloyl-ACP methyl ester carboxylesterase
MTIFLISLRDSGIGGVPGTKPGKTHLIAIPDPETNYNLLGPGFAWPEWLALLASQGPSVVVFVHGFGDTSDKVVARHKSIKAHLPPGVTLVSFDWPAGNLIDPYKTDKGIAQTIAPRLMTDCLGRLINVFDPANVHLFAHSMGAYVTETAFQAASTIKINHVLMAAADVDQLNYVQGSARLTNFLGKCADLTAYWSTDDAALQQSVKEDINKGAVPLGLKGYPDPDVPPGCQGVQCTTYYDRYVQMPNPPGPPGEYSHVWYILYPLTPGPVNDFYTDWNRVLQQGPPSPPPPSSWPTRGTGFILRRPA